MKKALSFILAIILTFSVGLVAFASQEEVPSNQKPITTQQAEALAVDFLIDSTYSHKTVSTLYNDYKFYTNLPVYEVTSDVTLKSGDKVVYTTYVDQYSGKVVYRNAQLKNVMLPLTKSEAIEYAYKVLSITPDGTVKITDKETTNQLSQKVYQFTFCKSNLIRYDCSLNAETGFIDKVSVGKPANLVERILLLFKMLLAKINILGKIESLNKPFDFTDSKFNGFIQL